MTTSKWVQTNFNTQDPTTYKGSIDANFAVAARVVDRYAPRAADSPAMSVVVDAGYVFDGSTLTVIAQSTNTISAAPGSPNSRIDRVVVDRLTGALSVVTGTPAVSPLGPSIPSGKAPVAKVTIGTSVTVITNADIIDERDLSVLGRGLAGDLNIGALLKQDTGTGLTIADSGGQAWIVSGGTADAITATFSPAIPTLTDGHLVSFRATAANATTTPTFAPNGGTARTITKLGGIALAPGDIPGNLAEVFLRYNLSNTRWELINPALDSIPSAVAGGTANAITATYSPAIPALYDGLLLALRASGANSVNNPTFAPNGLTAHAITKNGGSVLANNDIPGNLAEILLKYNLANTRWELLNPQISAGVKTVKRQIITSSGTYTPSTGMLYAEFELLGGGGGGGGSTGNSGIPGYGGGASGYVKKLIDAATIGASQSVTIGAGGSAGSSSGTPGGTGGNSALGAILAANGGHGGSGSAANDATLGVGGTATGGDINRTGDSSYYNVTGTLPNGISGKGASTIYGEGADPATGGNVGNPGQGYGSGASGASNTSTNKAGAIGAPGVLIVTEWCSQ